MKKRILPQEIDNLINLLDSGDNENWKLALNILANPSFKVKRQLCQVVKFARIYVKHPHIIYNYTTLNGIPYTWKLSHQIHNLVKRCLKYLKLYRDYDKRRIR